MYASPEIAALRPALRTRPAIVGHGQRVHACMHRHIRRTRLPAGSVRNALVLALLHPVQRSFSDGPDGVVRLGRGPGAHRLVRLRGARLLLPAHSGALDPRWVTLVRRAPLGGISVVAGVGFGGAEIEVSARLHGIAPTQLRAAVDEAVDLSGGPAGDWLTPLLLWCAGAG